MLSLWQIMVRIKTVHFGDSFYHGFSNFSAHQIEFRGRIYPTSEHLYQASKFFNSDNPEAHKIFQKILDAKSPYNAKQIAHKNRESYRREWRLLNFKIYTMYRILILKVNQHQDVKQALLITRNKKIIETSYVDDFWGQTLAGKGENWLGRCWMRVRDEHLNKTEKDKST
jgi:ribA/ribD-fused uncharacterized protein